MRSTDGTVQELLLVEVSGRATDHRIEQFSLIFRGDAETPLADGTYDVSHGAMKMSPIFIGGVGRASGAHLTYEACFSRLLSEA